MHPAEISISDYTYNLPDSRIAMHPLEQRDDSKLLIYNNLCISECLFSELPKLTGNNEMLVFNDTRVINARIVFRKPTGGRIEVFCLEPAEKNGIPGENTWNCLVGGASKWKEGELVSRIDIGSRTVTLRAECIGRNGPVFAVRFSWDPADLEFEEVIRHAGTTPLPPYIKREAVAEDSERYQTVYAAHPGSVAAPTAGLHFTPNLLARLKAAGIKTGHVTLHVGAGTFKPVDAAPMEGHQMHAEWIEVSAAFIRQLLDHKGKVTAVGTTGVRTLETLYWLGVKTLLKPGQDSLKLSQWEVYEEPLLSSNISRTESLNALLDLLEKNQQDKLVTATEILIAPGYRFRICNSMITNFHQPGSTLLLLVAAAVGDDWKRIYDYALSNDFRFLSYGDACLLQINQG